MTGHQLQMLAAVVLTVAFVTQVATAIRRDCPIVGFLAGMGGLFTIAAAVQLAGVQ